MACFVAVLIATALSISSASVVVSGPVSIVALQAEATPVILPASTPVPAKPGPVARASVSSADATSVHTPVAAPWGSSAVSVSLVVAAPGLVVDETSMASVSPGVELAPELVQLDGPDGPADVINQLPESAFRWLEANNWTVQWRQGPGPGRQAEAQYATSTIVIWHDNSYSSTTWASVFAHELGHAVAYVHFDTQQMDDWNAMRGIDSWRWVPGGSGDFSVGEGDFAEAFMSYLLGHAPRSTGGPLTQAHAAWIAANTPF